MAQYLVEVGLDLVLHYYGKTLSLCGSCIHLHAASTVFADSYTPPFRDLPSGRASTQLEHYTL